MSGGDERERRCDRMTSRNKERGREIDQRREESARGRSKSRRRSRSWSRSRRGRRSRSSAYRNRNRRSCSRDCRRRSRSRSRSRCSTRRNCRRRSRSCCSRRRNCRRSGTRHRDLCRRRGDRSVGSSDRYRDDGKGRSSSKRSPSRSQGRQRKARGDSGEIVQGCSREIKRERRSRSLSKSKEVPGSNSRETSVEFLRMSTRTDLGIEFWYVQCPDCPECFFQKRERKRNRETEHKVFEEFFSIE